MILKYIFVILALASLAEAKVGTCTVGDSKNKFVSCLEHEAIKTNAIEDMNFLAAFYTMDKEYDKAVAWYKKSAEKGDAKAAFFLGGVYDEALDNKKEALKWYKKATMREYDDAMQHLNETMENVYGKSETIKIYEEAINKGEDVYWNKQFLANFYFRVGKYNKRIEIYKELIKEYPERKGDWLVSIGNTYMKDSLNNREKELEYYRQAAKYGNKMAMHNLGIYYGDIKDYKTAEMWFKKAGQNSMVCFMYKKIVKDKTRALECYKKEAENNNTQSIINLASTYSSYEDYEQALREYKKASKLGDENATYLIGSLYKYIYHDKNKSINWYKKAASMGNEKAIKHLRKKGLL